jgi:ribosome-associated toxin RatA of RatAB toxin-antitoxin module
VHTSTSIVIRAPRKRIFETAADLALWPKILPHYRFIQFLERTPERTIVKMAASRSGIPISWVSELQVDPQRMEVRFKHLRAWTKGMLVVWTLTETPEGVLVEIVHDLKFRWPFLAPVAELVIGRFFIENIASKTLRCMKEHLEHNES